MSNRLPLGICGGECEVAGTGGSWSLASCGAAVLLVPAARCDGAPSGKEAGDERLHDIVGIYIVRTGIEVGALHGVAAASVSGSSLNGSGRASGSWLATVCQG